MRFQKLAVKASAVSLSAAILFGAGGPEAFAETATKDYKETYGTSQITRSDMKDMISQHGDAKFEVPKFDASTIKNIPSAKKYDKDGNLIKMDVWDTWPPQNADGTVANYKGYNIVFGLAGDPKNANDTFIYMFYKKQVTIPSMPGKMPAECLMTTTSMKQTIAT